MTDKSQPNCYAIGLDVGGTKIAGGIVALDSGQVWARITAPTQPERGGDGVLSTALDLAEALWQQASSQGLAIAGIGVGLCELVDPAGRVTSGHTVRWQGMPVRERFSRLAPTVVESDVRAAALAEALYGAGKAFDPFIYVTVGTGISSCLVQGGKPFRGARGNALVLATGPLTWTCPHCGERTRVVLEEVASGPALVARYNMATGRRYTQGEEVLAAEAAGDPIAVAVVESGGAALGMAVGWLVNVLDPVAIVVGGGLGMAGGRYWESFVTAARDHIGAADSRTLPIVQAKLGTDAGLIGAAAVHSFAA